MRIVLVSVLLSGLALHAQTPVEIRVDAVTTLGANRPMYAYFGYGQGQNFQEFKLIVIR